VSYRDKNDVILSKRRGEEDAEKREDRDEGLLFKMI
jgi:hypothetical protein